MSNKRLDNWIIRDTKVDGTIQYVVNEWCAAVEGPAFVSTIIVSNTNETTDENNLQMRIGDKRDDTLMLIEPKVVMPALVSDTFRNDSIVLKAGQRLEFKCSIVGMNILVSGAKL